MAIRIHSRYPETLTPNELINAIRAGGVSVNERIAREYFAETREATIETIYVNNGRKRVCIVRSGCCEDEFASWREAVLFFSPNFEQMIADSAIQNGFDTARENGEPHGPFDEAPRRWAIASIECAAEATASELGIAAHAFTFNEERVLEIINAS